MTARAILVLRMMGLRKLRLAVAGKTLAPEERSLVRFRRRVVRIMAAGARHTVTAHALAGALAELFDLADAAIRDVCLRPHVERQELRYGISRPVIQCRLPGAFDVHVPFEMAVNTDGVALIGTEEFGVHHRGFSSAPNMCGRVSMAFFAGDPGVEEWQRCVAIDGAGHA